LPPGLVDGAEQLVRLEDPRRRRSSIGIRIGIRIGTSIGTSIGTGSDLVRVLIAVVSKLEQWVALRNVGKTVVSLGVGPELLADRLRPGRSGLGKGQDHHIRRL